jgi:hypothetical protein
MYMMVLAEIKPTLPVSIIHYIQHHMYIYIILTIRGTMQVAFHNIITSGLVVVAIPSGGTMVVVLSRLPVWMVL